MTPIDRDTVTIVDTRDDAAAIVAHLHAAGNAAAIVGPIAGRYAAVNIDGPYVDIVDGLHDAGLPVEGAEDTAWRVCSRGY